LRFDRRYHNFCIRTLLKMSWILKIRMTEPEFPRDSQSNDPRSSRNHHEIPETYRVDSPCRGSLDLSIYQLVVTILIADHHDSSSAVIKPDCYF
jgi:hypothetical protein